jgi:hypothetical protein
MRKLLFSLAFSLLLAGCSTTGGVYGNYVADAPIDPEQLAADVAGRLMEIYPPALAHLVMGHEMQDSFGAALIKRLRGNGYSVQEYVSGAPIECHSTAALKQPKNTVAMPMRLCYVFDRANDGLYSLNILVGGQVISRPYLAQGDTLHPAGHWTRREP